MRPRLSLVRTRTFLSRPYNSILHAQPVNRQGLLSLALKPTMPLSLRSFGKPLVQTISCAIIARIHKMFGLIGLLMGALAFSGPRPTMSFEMTPRSERKTRFARGRFNLLFHRLSQTQPAGLLSKRLVDVLVLTSGHNQPADASSLVEIPG
jgi:hypothetical protein